MCHACGIEYFPKGNSFVDVTQPLSTCRYTLSSSTQDCLCFQTGFLERMSIFVTILVAFMYTIPPK